MRVAYFAHDLDDPAVGRRIAMFHDAGAQTLVFGFRRPTAADTHPPAAGRVLGHTANGRMVQRVLSVLSAALRLPGLVSGLEDCDVVVARNLEMLAVAATSRQIRRLGLPLVYESLDIHRLLSDSGLKSRLLRVVERLLLNRSELLIISSQRYVTEHFSRRYHRIPPVFLVENKVLASELSQVEGRSPVRSAASAWRIGWFGVLRCRKTLLMLVRLTLLMPDRFEVVIRGRPARDVIPDFDAIIDKAPGLHFGGAYDRERDLASIYSAVDLVWAIDFYEEHANSAWLLPNRLYESVLYGCIPIVSAASETGRWLHERGFAHTVGDVTFDGILAFFSDFDQGSVDRARSALSNIAREDVVCDAAQARAIVARLPTRSSGR